jgi:hypothetical protein
MNVIDYGQNTNPLTDRYGGSVTTATTVTVGNISAPEQPLVEVRITIAGKEYTKDQAKAIYLALKEVFDTGFTINYPSGGRDWTYPSPITWTSSAPITMYNSHASNDSVGAARQRELGTQAKTTLQGASN